MYYTRLKITCPSDFSEILIAEVAEAGFDSFIETDDGFEAFVENENYDEHQLSTIKAKYNTVAPLVFVQDRIEKQNWNEEWEKNVEPIIVEDQCLVRAEFHKPEKKYPIEIIITPKMSFGTGHHQTTHLMLKSMMRFDHKDKAVMDAGCGTAILSIMASKLGAAKIYAFDIDEWSVINGKENAEVNECNNITIQQGKISELIFSTDFDIVLANINRNILLHEMQYYALALKPKGKLLLSGFYENDIATLIDEAAHFDLKQVFFDVRENWAAVLLEKG